VRAGCAARPGNQDGQSAAASKWRRTACSSSPARRRESGGEPTEAARPRTPRCPRRWIGPEAGNAATEDDIPF